MSTFADAMMDAIEHTTSGPKAAWLMGRACYLYTRAHDGAVINEQGDTISFGRLYSFCAAVNCGWKYLW